MGRMVSIGAQGFEDIRNGNYFYVDKTDFIKEWWESGDKVTLITRPRRFGKTLNMNMLECFFSMKYAGRNDLFEGLNIWEDEKYREIQGTWPVIFLSFADIKQNTYELAVNKIRESIVDLYSKFAFLRNWDGMNPLDRSYFESVDYSLPPNESANALQKLICFLSRYYGKNVIVLLDEYDTPMQEAYVSGYWNEITAFFRSLFNSTFKTNPYLERAIMTGITRISKESIFSDLNNLRVVTTTSEQYATAFGFTEEEVFASLDEMEMSEDKENVKAWYDGFTFGKHTDIYNPWSITNFLEEKKYAAYWVNTSGNSLVSKLIQEGSPELKMAIGDLLKGKTLTCQIDEQIAFNQLDDNPEAIWSLFLAGGYLKVVTPPQLSGKGTNDDFIYELALTNREVYLMFEGLIRLWFRKKGSPYNQFVKALLKGDLEEMNAYINDVSENVFSYFDTGNKQSIRSAPERFYHGFVLGLLVELKGRYIVMSNRESGLGRYDVMLEPISREDPAIILEFKVHNPKAESDLQATVAAAHAQIEEKHYAASLEEKGIEPERIRKYGFAFEGKTVLIG